MTKNGFQDQLLLNAGQKYCRMLQGEHSAILSTFIMPPTLKKLKGHIALGLYVCVYVCMSMHPLQKKIIYSFEIS